VAPVVAFLCLIAEHPVEWCLGSDMRPVSSRLSAFASTTRFQFLVLKALNNDDHPHKLKLCTPEYQHCTQRRAC
jgi:hypothetical protein